MLTFADSILEENMHDVRQWVARGVDVNQIDPYGFTPLIEAAIVNNVEISQYLLEAGASSLGQDVTGGTALHWAVENNNLNLTRLLLKYHADPNATNLAGQPVLVMPILRRQQALKTLLIQADASLLFAQDYINTKLLGHVFELVGLASIVNPQNHYIDVDFEGFYLPVTLDLISHALAEFQNHFAARKWRHYFGVSQLIIDCLSRARELIQYQQYRVDKKKVNDRIEALLAVDPLIIPVGYEGHAITFIKFGEWWVKCDRREDSRLFDNIMFYRINNPQNLTTNFIKSLIYVKQTDNFINHELDHLLDLQPITELKIESQISGNCSWANVEAAIPALFFMILLQSNEGEKPDDYYKTLTLNFFHRWRDWNKERLLQFCIQSYNEADSIRKACKAEILAAILFQRCDLDNRTDRDRIESIASLLISSPYNYILKNYLRVCYYQNITPAGKRFAEFLKEYNFP